METLTRSHSTRIPDELQGKGFGKVMMESVLPEIEQAGFKVGECAITSFFADEQKQ